MAQFPSRTEVRLDWWASNVFVPKPNCTYLPVFQDTRDSTFLKVTDNLKAPHLKTLLFVVNELFAFLSYTKYTNLPVLL